MKLLQKSIHFDRASTSDNIVAPVVVYPDITILLSQRELLLWEHNGMLSNEEYRRRNNRKMELYFLNGFYQPKNLIVTADGPNGEFSIPDIYRIVDGLILPRL